MQTYIDNYNRYWEHLQHSVHSPSQDIQLQSLPTNTTSNQTNLLTHSSAIRNSYLISQSIGNDCNDQIKSAFKPVKPRISINPIPTILPKIWNKNFELSNHTSSVDSNDTLKTLPDSIYASSYESYNHINSTTLENVKREMSTKYDKTPKKNETNFRMAYKYVADKTGQVGAVYHWDTLLPVLPEKKTYKALPTRQRGTRIQHRQKFKAFHDQITQFEDNAVPIIDLTSEHEQTDKIDETVQNLKVSNAYQTNKTPPIDVNENEKLIIQKLTLPPKKQIKLTAKHNQWQKQIRTYNGFRLFARRNQSYAKEYANETNNESIVNSVLVKWWNTASANEKEHYAQVAEVIIENQSSSTSAVATDDKKMKSDFPVSEHINTIPNQECDKSSNELPIDIVFKKNTDAEIGAIVSGAKPSNRENEPYLPNDNDNNSFFRTSLNSLDKFIQM